MNGGLAKIEIAPWDETFDEATATWVDIPKTDVVEDNIQHPTHEEATVNVADGVAYQTGKRSNMALPIRNLTATYLATLEQNSRQVVRLTYLEDATPNKLVFGALHGAVLRKHDPSGANFGGVGVILLQFQTTSGADQASTTAS